MALISAKNLVTPLTNKIHLTTIVLIVVAFAFLRLSGGKLSLESKSSSKEKSSSFSAPEKPKGSNPAGNIRDNSSLPWQKKPANPNPANSQDKAKSLDDIEKLFRK